MKFAQRPDTFLEQILHRMPATIRATFTPAQVEALQAAFGRTMPKRHLIDLRPSFSIRGRGIYVVLLVGLERRSPQRLHSSGAKRTALICVSIPILVLGTFATLSFLLPRLESSFQPHPTSIPWLQTESACEHSGRFWQNDTCWDNLHSPDF